MNSRRRTTLAILFGGGLALATGCSRRADETIAPARVFAASSLTNVLQEISLLYAATGRPAPVLNLGASAALARQIEQGADAGLFIPADLEWMAYLQDRGLIVEGSESVLLTNRLVLVAAADNGFEILLEPGADLAGALGDGRLAIADPEGAPAGRYARQALEAIGAWQSVSRKLVLAETVRAALRYAETGEAAAAIVYATDAKAAQGRVTLAATFDSSLHDPILYPMALVTKETGESDGESQAFAAFLRSPAARVRFDAAGFGTPEAS